MALSQDTRQSAIRRGTELLCRTMISNATISSALDLPLVFPEFKNGLFQSHMAGETAMRTVLAEIGTELVMDSKTFSMMAERMAGQAAVNAETVISAATIVLAHSTADDVFTGACGIAIDLAPERWEPELNLDKKIRLGDLREIGSEGIFVRELQQFKARLPAKSLPSRAALLFQHVPIRKHKDIVQQEHSYYRESKLEEADKLRHEIIHGSGLPRIPIEKSKAVTAFLHEAATTAFRSLSVHFGLPWDMKYFQKLIEENKRK